MLESGHASGSNSNAMSPVSVFKAAPTNRYERANWSVMLVVNPSGIAAGSECTSNTVRVELPENFQTSEAQVRVPEVLRPYLGGRELL